MTTEDDFQRMLEINPGNHTTRLILADYLQEHDDPRWEGYKALGLTHYGIYISEGYFLIGREDNDCRMNQQWEKKYGHSLFPLKWYELTEPKGLVNKEYYGWWKSYKSRRKAEDAAALAFSRLTPEEKIAILHPCKEEILGMSVSK